MINGRSIASYVMSANEDELKRCNLAMASVATFQISMLGAAARERLLASVEMKAAGN
jgi:hypothetical protein